MYIDIYNPISDFTEPISRVIHFARRRIFRDSGIIVLSAALMCAVSTAVWAGQPSWREHSESYEVHLGVVSASVADRDSALFQMHKISPHGGVKRTAALRHIMVAVFKRPGKERVLNADVSAEVIENDLIHTKRQKKNLDTMMLPSGASYCNFFILHWNGPYQIKVRISEQGKSTEWLIFDQEARGLPG